MIDCEGSAVPPLAQAGAGLNEREVGMKARSFYIALSVLFLSYVAAPAVHAEPTEITVRVLSRDAKFIGTSMDGARITIRDAISGEVLAEGTTEGETGDTERLMKRPLNRRDQRATEGSAKFTVTLDIAEPRKIEIVAEGPLAKATSANRVSATQWILPGKHLTEGDGWVLEIPGFFVAADTPAKIGLAQAKQAIVLKANVSLMCGCPITPGGMWDAEQYEVRAQLKQGKTVIDEVVLVYAGRPSQFSGTLKASAPGQYQALVYAYDRRTGNTGVDTVSVDVAGP